MRIQIRYETRYAYEGALRSLTQVLRLTPRGFEGQRVLSWRVETDLDVRTPSGEDAFGNLVHTLSCTRPIRGLSVLATGVVETRDVAGLVSGLPEPLPVDVFLRPTPLTAADRSLAAFARDVAAGEGERLGQVHALLREIHARVRYAEGETDAATTAAEAFARGAGVCQDLAHVFIAACRTVGIPARYVSGHLLKLNGEVRQTASHAWAEAHVEGLGWVGFDPASGACPTETHVRVAAGFDYLSAAPVRGVRHGGGREDLGVELEVAEARRQGRAQAAS